MEQHVKILGILNIVLNAFLLLAALIVFVVLVGGSLISGEREAMIAMFGIGTLVACFLMVLAAPGMIGGYFLLQYKNWARILVIILGVLNILNFPLGTALGAYTLWVLLNKETEVLFT
jgi:hypothetical protein